LILIWNLSERSCRRLSQRSFLKNIKGIFSPSFNFYTLAKHTCSFVFTNMFILWILRISPILESIYSLLELVESLWNIVEQIISILNRIDLLFKFINPLYIWTFSCRFSISIKPLTILIHIFKNFFRKLSLNILLVRAIQVLSPSVNHRFKFIFFIYGFLLNSVLISHSGFTLKHLFNLFLRNYVIQCFFWFQIISRRFFLYLCFILWLFLNLLLRRLLVLDVFFRLFRFLLLLLLLLLASWRLLLSLLLLRRLLWLLGLFRFLL